MSLKLYMLRHGETVFSINRGYCGALDVKLTESGQVMAQAFADEYKSMDWEAIYGVAELGDEYRWEGHLPKLEIVNQQSDGML